MSGLNELCILGGRSRFLPKGWPIEVDLSTVAQLLTVLSEFLLVLVFGVGYYFFIKQNRQTLEQNQKMLTKMQASRTVRGRPQVVVEAGYDHLPMVDLVVRNVGGGAAQDIEFSFSAPFLDRPATTFANSPI
jgi:hypothetical protein